MKPAARPPRRKWVRHERRYSNAMWHAGWHEIKSRPQRRHLVAYMDDASRCITGFGMFGAATAASSVAVLRSAISEFGAPGQVVSWRGAQFVSGGARGGKNCKPTEFERELADRGIGHDLAQSGGKLRKFFHTLETEAGHFASVADFIGYYNERRLHFSLDIDRRETPLRAFRNKRADEDTRAAEPRWMEAGA